MKTKSSTFLETANNSNKRRRSSLHNKHSHPELFNLILLCLRKLNNYLGRYRIFDTQAVTTPV